MNYGDFASIVQLGVGLHLGTALLQLYTEFDVQPLIRSMDRINSLQQSSDFQSTVDIEERIATLKSDFDIFKIQHFQEYKFYVIANAIVATILTLSLVAIAYCAEQAISPCLSVPLVALCILPAPITLGVLWIDASRALKPLLDRARDLEADILDQSGGSH